MIQHPEPEDGRLVAIGGSAGAISALQGILRDLPADFPAAIFIALHGSSQNSSHLVDALQPCTALPVRPGVDGAPLQPATVTVAPPDRHLLLSSHRMVVGHGPRENRFRPAIDPLFRSAAVHGAHRAAGLLLSGSMDDGVSGLFAIQRCGGLTLVQTPDDAEYPELPQAALDVMQPDHCLPARAVGVVLAQWVRQPLSPAKPIPRDLEIEAGIAEGVLRGTGTVDELGQMVPFSCPECGGQLWQQESPPPEHYRCYEGHTFSASALDAAQTSRIERALWVSLRMLEENSRMLKRIRSEQGKRGHRSLAAIYDNRLKETEEHAAILRKLLFSRS